MGPAQKGVGLGRKHVDVQEANWAKRLHQILKVLHVDRTPAWIEGDAFCQHVPQWN
jgi:hypothetical protein